MRDRNPLTHYLTGAALLLCCAAVLTSQCGCTYNHITFETDSVRFTDAVTVEPGQGGDSSDTGNNASTPTGGTGKLSPGGSNLIDGMLNLTLLIQQGGETPTTPTTTIDAQIPLK